MERKKVLLLINPNSGKKNSKGQLLDALNELSAHNYQMEVYVSQKQMDICHYIEAYGENFDVGQHGADGDHQRALHQHPGLGVRFRHKDSSSHNNSTQKQNAPAFLAGARAVCENRDLSANYLRRHYPDQVQGSLPTADLSLTAPLFSCPLSV